MTEHASCGSDAQPWSGFGHLSGLGFQLLSLSQECAVTILWVTEEAHAAGGR